MLNINKEIFILRYRIVEIPFFQVQRVLLNRKDYHSQYNQLQPLCLKTFVKAVKNSITFWS